MADDSSGSGRGVNGKLLLIGILVLVIGALAIANSQKVKVDFILHDFTISLFIVIVGAAVIGWVVGWFMGRSRD